LRRERWETQDGDFLDLDHAFDGTQDSRAPLVVVLHGLEGSSRSKYALQTYRAIHDAGARAVGLNFRGCSGELNRLPRSYHSGETEDLAFVLERLRERTDVPMGLIGFSLGGNILLKFLGERGEAARDLVAAASVISVPYDLAAGALFLQRPGGWIYRSFLLRKLRRKIKAKRALLPKTLEIDRIARARSFHAFDDAATAPLHGFAGADDYYARSSSRSFLESIRVPTMLIHALDDPFVPGHAVPHDEVRRNPYLVSRFSRDGGHVGFVSGAAPWRLSFWAEKEAARFVTSIVGPDGDDRTVR
jgi:predicted alpha/beta-fold hydrolase